MAASWMASRRRRVAGVLVLTGSAAVAGVAGLGGAAAAQRVSKAKVVPLIVYSAQGYDKLATTDFSKKYHIPVQLEDNSTGPLVTQVEASKNNPKWDVLWVDGPTVFAGLDQQGMLLRNWEPNVKWNALGTASVPKDKSYVPTGVTLMPALVYDATKVKNPPKTYQQLLSPQWKGKIGMNDPSVSGPTYPFVAGMMNYLGGVKQGEAFFSKLKANGLVINQTNGNTLQALASGQIELALIQSSAAAGAYFTNHNMKVEYLDPATLLPGVAAIDGKSSPEHQAEAKLFIEYLLSRAGQKVMQAGDPTGDSLYYPVVQGVKPRNILPSLASVKTQTIDPYKWGSLENQVNSWFTANIVQ